MDIRTERTKRNLINAFIELRAKKSIKKITVKELTDLAVVNKATFYRYYKDIYDLSESIENELIENCVADISDPDILFSKDGYFRLARAFSTQSELFNIIFSGTRQDVAVHKIHNALCGKIYEKYTEFETDTEKRVILSAMIYGAFHAFLLYKNEDFDTLIGALSKSAEIFDIINNE